MRGRWRVERCQSAESCRVEDRYDSEGGAGKPVWTSVAAALRSPSTVEGTFAKHSPVLYLWVGTVAGEGIAWYEVHVECVFRIMAKTAGIAGGRERGQGFS